MTSIHSTSAFPPDVFFLRKNVILCESRRIYCSIGTYAGTLQLKD